jgi:hypothetical protein
MTFFANTPFQAAIGRDKRGKFHQRSSEVKVKPFIIGLTLGFRLEMPLDEARKKFEMRYSKKLR